MGHLLSLRVMIAQRTRVKICGITRLQDALVAQESGVDALGFVFVPASGRYINPDQAAPIAAQMAPFTSIVGLFLNAPETDVQEALSRLPHMTPQFHGNESAEYCESFGRPYIKALGVGNGMPDSGTLSEYESALGFMFDSNAPGELGGTGHAFDWNQLESNLPSVLILAGGLDVNNVPEAISQVAPYAVDVSSGVESAKGIKCADRVRAFMQAVHDADLAQA